jgi:hypothetical protein
LADNAVDTAEIADNAVTLAKMDGLARGTLIYGDASGDPAALAVGSANEVLTHDGTDFDWAAASVFDVSSITGATALGATPADTDEFVLSDAGVLKRVDYSYLKAGDNKPFFRAYNNAGFTATADTYTNFGDTEVFDIGSCYDTSTGRFTPDVAGYYYFNVHARTTSAVNFSYISARIRKNGTEISSGVNYNESTDSCHATTICQLDGSSDYVEGMIYCPTTNRDFYGAKSTNGFIGFKLIGT